MFREVVQVITSHRQTEGGGFVVRRPFPTRGFAYADPFLLLDEMGPVEYRPGEAIGAPDHPHRGFETVTYVLEGEAEHADSAGHRGRIGPGDVQWMTAGRGVVHAEMPSRVMQALDVPLPRGHAAYVYVFDGAVAVAGRTLHAGQFAVLGAGDTVPFAASDPGQALLLSGIPLGEPVVQHGPFVMNTAREIEQAILDYRAGRLAAIDHTEPPQGEHA